MVKAPPLFAAAMVVAGIAAAAPEAFPPPPPIGGVDAPLASEVGDSGCWAATDLSETAAVETEENGVGGAKAAAAPTGMRTSAPPSSVPPSPPMSH